MMTVLSCLAATSAGLASMAAAADAAPAGFISPGQATLISLGAGGLLYPMFNDEQYGVIQGRVNTNRATLGAATAPGAPQSGYEDEDFAGIFPLQVLVEIPSLTGTGAMFLFGSAVLTPVDARPNQIELDGDIRRFDAQIWYSPRPTTLFTFGVEHDRVALDIVNAGPGFTVNRESFGVRADVLHRFDRNYGVTGRVEYQFATDLATRVPGPPPRFFTLTEQGDDRFYTQWDLVANFTNRDVEMIPPQWSLQPTLGFAYNRSMLETVRDSNGGVGSGERGSIENYLLGFGRLRAERTAFAPWSVNPAASVGFEQEIVSDLDELTRDRTYATATAGFGVVLPYNTRLDVEYTLRQGLEGVRRNQSVAAVLSFSF